MHPELTPDEVAVLRSVGAERIALSKVKPASAARREAALAILKPRGLIDESVGPRKARQFSLTPAGLEALKQVPAASASARPPKADERLARIESTVLQLWEAVQRIESKLNGGVPQPAPAQQASPQVTSSPPVSSLQSPRELADAVLSAAAELDSLHRYGGLVPIPELRRELRRRGVAAADAEVDQALERLEREFVIDLNVAETPGAAPERSAGIERPGRGLLYYVTRRSS
jgi:hypothetical protein